jgi:transposase-like protein
LTWWRDRDTSTRRYYSRQQKKEALDFLMSHQVLLPRLVMGHHRFRRPTLADAAAHFGITRATIHRWWKEWKVILDSADDNPCPAAVGETTGTAVSFDGAATGADAGAEIEVETDGSEESDEDPLSWVRGRRLLPAKLQEHLRQFSAASLTPATAPAAPSPSKQSQAQPTTASATSAPAGSDKPVLPPLRLPIYFKCSATSRRDSGTSSQTSTRR